MGRDAFVKSISSLDARSDNNIKNYFVLTDAIRAASDLTAPSRAIVGLKGAGKTTLYRALVEQWTPQPDITTVGLSASDATFDTYFEKVNCLQFEASVKVGMLLFLLRLINENIDQFGGHGSPTDWAERTKLLFNPTQKIGALLNRFQGFSVMGVGLTLRPGERIETFQPLQRDDLQELVRVLKDFGASGRKIRVVIDDPDRLFTRGTNFDPHLLAGYILGTNYVATELEFVQFIHVLKSSVYDMLRDVEEMANLPIDYFNYISWQTKELSQIIQSRLIFSNTSEEDVFQDSSADVISMAIAEIRNGPRDLLRYFEIALKSQAHSERISIGSLSDSLKSFRDEARRQMESAYTSVYPGIESFVEAVFLDSSELTVSEFLSKFERMRIDSEPSNIDYGSHWLKRGERALRALTDAGIIDVRIHGGWVRPFEATYFRFNSRDRDARIRINSVFLT